MVLVPAIGCVGGIIGGLNDEFASEIGTLFEEINDPAELSLLFTGFL